MNNKQTQRRRLLKAGLLAPLLIKTNVSQAFAISGSNKVLDMPPEIREELVRIYGEQARHVLYSKALRHNLPSTLYVANIEQFKIMGERDRFQSLAILIENQSNPLFMYAKFHAEADLPIDVRILLNRTSNVYLIGQTKNGLIGYRQHTRVTIGCYGG